MAEVTKTASDPPSAGGTRSGTGFELRLERGGASVRLEDRELAPGLSLEVLTIQIPDVRFPFDVGQGASQFRPRDKAVSIVLASADNADAINYPYYQGMLGAGRINADRASSMIRDVFLPSVQK